VIFTCEYQGTLAKIDLMNRKVVTYLRLSKGGMRQDIRISPDGTIFFVAELTAGGVYLIDGESFTEVGFIKTGVGTHGLYPSRDGTQLYVSNRGFPRNGGRPHGPGSVAVIDFATRRVVKTVATPTPAAVAARNATRTIPIVMRGVGDPVGLGLVESLARPGGNVTGLSYTVGTETIGKGLVRRAVPGPARWPCARAP
jgi:DNA-binding beta-propeller fold protein YncE